MKKFNFENFSSKALDVCILIIMFSLAIGVSARVILWVVQVAKAIFTN